MTPHQISLVQSSFGLVRPNRTEAAELFYSRLFAIDPALRLLFQHSGLVQQGAKLMASLSFVIDRLTSPEQVVPVLQSLGARHHGYGVTDDDYASVGAALIDTLDAALADAFTPDVRAAWEAAFGLVARTMMAGAHVVPKVAVR